MALRKCGGCQKEIGANAAVCPQCGEPAPKRTVSLTTVIGVSLAAVFLWNIVSRAVLENAPAGAAAAVATPAASVPTVDQSPKMQAERLEMIGSLRERGVFGEVTCGQLGARAAVRPGFYRLEFAQKKVFVSVLAAYCFVPSFPYGAVTLVDSKTNKAVGSFNSVGGLKLE